MAKGRNRRGREAKKPKAEKKAAPVVSTFLRPQPPEGQSPAKETPGPSK